MMNAKAVAMCNRERISRRSLVPLHANHSLMESANRALGVGRVPKGARLVSEEAVESSIHCKYYANTLYIHPIRHLLKHRKNGKDSYYYQLVNTASWAKYHYRLANVLLRWGISTVIELAAAERTHHAHFRQRAIDGEQM